MQQSEENLQITLLRELVAEVRALRADIKRNRAPEATERFVEALEDYFGSVGTFRVSGLFDIASESPHSEIANAMGELIDMNAPERSKATQLGRLLSRIP